MDDHFALFAVDHVRFFPGEVVVIFEVEQNLSAEILGDVLMNKCVVGGGVFAHEFHRGPIFLAFRLIEGKPGETLQFLREILMLLRCEFTVVVAHSGTCSATAAVTQEREIFAGLESMDFFFRLEDSEFDEMISAAAGAELRPGFVFVLPGDRAAGPILVENSVVAARFKNGADAEAGFFFDGAR